METIIEVAANISTPLALGGIITAFMFFTFRQVLSMGIFPKVKQTLAGKIILKIINAFLIIAVLSIVLGFIGYIMPLALNAYYPKLDPEYVNVGTDEDKTLEQIVDAIKQSRNITINFSSTCDQTRLLMIEKGEHEGNNIKDFLERLKQRVKNAEARYHVEIQGEQRYEIICQ